MAEPNTEPTVENGEAKAIEEPKILNPVVPDTIHPTTPQERGLKEDYAERIERLKKKYKDKLGDEEKERNKYRDQVAKVTPMGIKNSPRTWYWIFYLVIGLITFFPALIVTSGLVKIVGWYFGVPFAWTPAVFFAVIASLTFPYAFTFLKLDWFYKTVENGRLGVMEYWNGVIAYEGYKPLRPDTYLALIFLHNIRQYKVEKLTIQVTGSEDKTVELPVQGANIDKDVTATVEFAAAMTIAYGLDDIRDLELAFTVSGERDPDKALKKIGDRLSNRVISSMREICTSFEGFHTQDEAIAFNEEAEEILKWMAADEAWKSGVIIESIAPRLQLPKDQREENQKAIIEKAQRLKIIEDTFSTLVMEYIRATGDRKVDVEKLEAWAAQQPKVEREFQAVAKLVEEGKLGANAIQVFRTGGSKTNDESKANAPKGMSDDDIVRQAKLFWSQKPPEGDK